MSQLAIAKDLVTLGNDVLFAFRRASGAFARHRDESQILSPSEAACKAELQRFQLWVISLGLFQSSHNSLDYRLRQNETVRSMIAALLTDLCLALDDLFDELSRDTNNNNDDAKELESEMHSGSGANVEAQLFQSVDRSEVSDSSSGDVDEENLTTMYMDDVIEINDELMKIAMQIRSPSSRKPRHKTYPPGGTAHGDQDVYTDVLKSFRKKGIEQTLLSARLRTLSIDRADTSPVLRDSDEFLVDRLSKANDFRRQQFEYWRKYRSHSVRATTNATGAADADDSHDKIQPRATLTPAADVAFVRSEQKAPKTVSMPSVSLLAPDFKLRSVRSARTHQSRALTVHTPSGDLIAWPEVPSSVPIGKEFECPLCFFICPQEQRTGEPWRVHLKHDLCPYMCTFPDCSQPDTLYESRDQWIQHEQWSHMCFWRCPKDDIEFEDLPSYETHVIAQHPVAAEKNQLLSEGVLATQKFLAEQPSRSCPFCDVDLDGAGEMYDHIGSHLETVALLAIPQLDDRELQPKSDAASSVAAGKDADGSRKNDFDETSPVVFPENDDSDECSPAEQDHKLTFANYLSMCRADPDLLESLSGDIGASMWSTAMEELEPKPRALLEICAVLGANKIEERIFTSSIPDKDFPSGLLLSKSTYISARSAILRRSLIQHNSNLDEIYVHPIVQVMLLSKMSFFRKPVVLTATIFLVFRTWEPTSIYQRHMDQIPEDRSQLVPHVIQLQRFMQGTDRNLGVLRTIAFAAQTSLPFRVMRPSDPEFTSTQGVFVKLLVDAGWWLNERGRFSEIEPLVTLAMGLHVIESDLDFLEIQFDTLYLWTDIMNKTNRITQPSDRLRELLVIAFNISGQRTFWEFLPAKAYNQIGVALCLSNKFAEGIEEFINSIKQYHQLPKPGGGIDTEPKVNMALAHWRLGDLARAEEILQGTDYTWKARYGAMEGYLPGRIMHALGNVRYDQGRFHESKELHERALQQYETKFGKDHHKTADLCHKVAQHCILRAEYGRARTLIDQGLAIWQREERFHQPELARTTFLKATLEEKCGNEEEAARLRKTAREMRNKVPHATVKTDEEPLTEGDFDEIVAFFAR